MKHMTLTFVTAWSLSIKVKGTGPSEFRTGKPSVSDGNLKAKHQCYVNNTKPLLNHYIPTLQLRSWGMIILVQSVLM